MSGIFWLPNLDFDFFFHQWLQKEPRTKKIRNNNFEIRNGCQAFSGYLIWILISFFTSGFKKEPRAKKIRNNNFEIRNGCQAFSGYLIWILISFFTSGFKKIQEPFLPTGGTKTRKGEIIKLKIPE
ncbi:MAG: hypothetical protein E6H09_20635 [Bacteroidetes bacterium]|nr:MAG: hypothetical protein E6H09_20635 [Bacteroidota bacterium]